MALDKLDAQRTLPPYPKSFVYFYSEMNNDRICLYVYRTMGMSLLKGSSSSTPVAWKYQLKARKKGHRA
jgi:hypothetical protein